MSMVFQVLTVVRLMTPDPRPSDGPDDDRIQAEHIAYLRGLGEQGLVAVNGPIRAVDSPDWRGLTVYLVDVDEARALANADPAVQAGWFDVVVDPWWIPAREVTLGNRVDLTLDG
jgi:uncharacterized protein YciI